MTSLNLFRKVALAEGISYILLLGVAMPLRHFYNLPLAVKYMGWAHGVLFILYGACLIMAWQERKWAFGKVFMIFLASLFPFAPFFVDKKLKLEEEQHKGKM
jgi:integral membrane protein